MTKPEYDPGLTIVEVDGTYVVEYKWRTYRFMFSDGRVVDVIGINDNSDVRGEALKFFKAERIEGSCRLPLEQQPIVTLQKTEVNEPAPPVDEPKPPAKKAAAKKTAAKKAAGTRRVRADGTDATGTDG
jgi:hypothetical protein